MIFGKRENAHTTEEPELTQEQSVGLIRSAFESSPSFFKLLSTLRTRRVGMGYQVESGQEETFDWASGHPATQRQGPLNYVSEEDPIELTQTEEALLLWAATGINGMVLGDIPVEGGLSRLISFKGRTSPSSSNDGAVEMFVINDRGVFLYRPNVDSLSIQEIASEEDYVKILNWYKKDLIQISNSRPDVSWPANPEGTKTVNAMGPAQYNLNRPGSTWLLPVGDVGLEWFNQLLTSYEFSGFYLMDPDTNEPAGCKEWIRPGFLEVGFPIPAFDELALMLHAGQVGAIVQNIRIATEAMGLGSWMTGSYADDLVLGAYPEIAKGLGFSFLSRENTLNPTSTMTCQGLEGIKDAVMVPSKRFPKPLDAIKYVADLPLIQGRSLQGTRLQGLGSQSSSLDNEQNNSGFNQVPYQDQVFDTILKTPKAYISDWVIEAAVKTVEYIVNKYGCAPAFINPMRAKISVQVHHVDKGFYEKFNIKNNSVAYGLTEAITSHFDNWHPH